MKVAPPAAGVATRSRVTLRAALSDLELPPPPAPGERERWEAMYDELGADGAYALLAYMAQEAVQTYGWMTAPEMVDGLGRHLRQVL